MKLQFDFIDKLRKVNGAATRVGIYALATCLGGNATMIYPHAKTAVVDDTWAYIGSANMNGRGADVASVHAVDFLDPPKGQQYNGPLELLFRDKFV